MARLSSRFMHFLHVIFAVANENIIFLQWVCAHEIQKIGSNQMYILYKGQ